MSKKTSGLCQEVSRKCPRVSLQCQTRTLGDTLGIPSDTKIATFEKNILKYVSLQKLQISRIAPRRSQCFLEIWRLRKIPQEFPKNKFAESDFTVYFVSDRRHFLWTLRSPEHKGPGEYPAGHSLGCPPSFRCTLPETLGIRGTLEPEGPKRASVAGRWDRNSIRKRQKTWKSRVQEVIRVR